MSGDEYVGGLMGLNQNNSTVSNSYSRGDVTRTSGLSASIGGFSGYNSSSIIRFCYSTGSVFESPGTDWDELPGGTDKGFIGTQVAPTTYLNNFFDSEASNQTSDGLGAATAKTTSEMQDIATFTDLTTVGLSTTAWDFVGDPNDDVRTNDSWDLCGTGNYPELEWENPGDCYGASPTPPAVATPISSFAVIASLVLIGFAGLFVIKN